MTTSKHTDTAFEPAWLLRHWKHWWHCRMFRCKCWSLAAAAAAVPPPSVHLLPVQAHAVGARPSCSSSSCWRPFSCPPPPAAGRTRTRRSPTWTRTSQSSSSSSCVLISSPSSSSCPDDESSVLARFPFGRSRRRRSSTCRRLRWRTVGREERCESMRSTIAEIR